MLSPVSSMSIALLLAAGPVSGARPIPRMQALPLPYDQISFLRDEKEIARYHFGPSLNRPFVYPVIGPSGRPLTRMGHPGDPYTHSHHNSVWISLARVNGVDFWSDHGSQERGRIIHDRIEQLDDGDDAAGVTSYGRWVTASGTVLLKERRETVVKALERGEWMLVIDLRLEAAGGPVTLEQKGQFGPIGVRVAKSLAVHFGGGRIRNSEGAEGELAIFRKPARWVDYSGQIAPGVLEGLTLMDHPSNPRHPAAFHVREDGWMGAVLTEPGPFVIEPGKPLQLRYAVYVHAGVPSVESIDAVWKRFAVAPLHPPQGPPKSAAECRHGDFRRFNVPRAFSSQAECEAFAKGQMR